MPTETPPIKIAGLTAPRAGTLQRVPLRTRQSGVTRAGWRLELECAEGRGALVLVEVSASESWYRGEGLLLGYSQEKLSELHLALTASHENEGNVGPQLG